MNTACIRREHGVNTAVMEKANAITAEDKAEQFMEDMERFYQEELRLAQKLKFIKGVIEEARCLA